MNRRRAKFLTVAGIVFCAVAVVLTILKIAVGNDLSLLIPSLFFIVGVVLIVASLAYYTEK